MGDPKLLVLFLLSLGSLLLVDRQVEAREPEPFTNLQILPQDIERRELFGIMRGFTEALGVRCQHCHVSDGAEPLPVFDFADDSKTTKKTARLMMRLVEDINAEYLKQLPTAPDPPTRLACATCHRGLTRPALLRQVLAETLKRQGLDEALAHYRQLRTEFYGRGRYDFGESELRRLAQDLQQDAPAAAVAFLELNLEFYPESALTHFQRGELAEALGDPARALESYRRALEIQPGNPDIARRIAALESTN